MQRRTIGIFFTTNGAVRLPNGAVRLPLRRTDDLQAGRRQTVHCSFISGYNGRFRNLGVILYSFLD